jgi:tagatose-6-phosphate ketose/aldose isomerase
MTSARIDPTAVPTQADGGATIVEIGQQPGAWREIAGAPDGDVQDFLRGILARPDVRIILTGAGSSAFVGEIAAPALRRHLNRRVEPIATTDIVAGPLDHLDRDSPESLATTALADELVTDVWHVIYTCDRDGQLARAHRGRPNARVVGMPARTNDAGFAMTSSLTSMLLSCLLDLGPARPAEVDSLARAAEHLIDRQPDIRALARAGKKRFVYLGSGPLAGLARESALKLLELTAGEVTTYFDSPLGFRHGPKSVLDGDTLVVVYISTDPHTRRYDFDIVAELRAQLGHDAVTVISTQPIPAALGSAVVLPGLDGLDDSQVALPYLVFAQYLALFTSLEHGKTPDNPFPSGEVSRVVKGVTIYPWDR